MDSLKKILDNYKTSAKDVLRTLAQKIGYDDVIPYVAGYIDDGCLNDGYSINVNIIKHNMPIFRAYFFTSSSSKDENLADIKRYLYADQRVIGFTCRIDDLAFKIDKDNDFLHRLVLEYILDISKRGIQITALSTIIKENGVFDSLKPIIFLDKNQTLESILIENDLNSIAR